MTLVAPRHGELSDFLALSDGLSIARIADILRCCTRTVRNYAAGRAPIPWHRIELLRLLTRPPAAEPPQVLDQSNAEEVGVTANIEPDPNAPDVPPAEMLAWVGVHAPHFLSSQRSFALYVRGWNVVDKIRRAKQEGSFNEVLARWRIIALELPKSWRSGRLLQSFEPPAYRRSTT
ncbi:MULTISPECIES: IS21 family transposase [unclassified Paraburkholderia]|uniref:IS21 family transposase n=1 Tax=unclassified Paraburkholderia TaxID=2615204 RepID=UPI002AB135ED|nr:MULTISPECIES: IS21 family transposase [unclassified Paraburkholderia]